MAVKYMVIRNSSIRAHGCFDLYAYVPEEGAFRGYLESLYFQCDKYEHHYWAECEKKIAPDGVYHDSLEHLLSCVGFEAAALILEHCV
jgi:hypothetical protein